ncbi:aldolase/citrate lyase family protein [Arthrobacter sp. OVS8]|nr:aldolase/citrate lyase family protein [Arthrobacter sp. OVS8]
MSRGPLNAGQLRRRLSEGDVTIGTFVGMSSATAAEVCAAAGADWILIDLEHGAGGEDAVRDGVIAAGSYGVPSIVRVESGDRIRIGRVLDQGAAGIMVPRLTAVDQAAESVRHMLYPPHGDRGVATYNRSCRWGMDRRTLTEPGQETLGVIQIETLEALASVEDIAAQDGVDVVFVGPWTCPTRWGPAAAGQQRIPRGPPARRSRGRAAQQGGRNPGSGRRRGRKVRPAGLPVRRHRLRLHHHGGGVP